MKKICIILVNYNGAEDTIECIKSLQENEKKIDYEIVVVDNKSTDDSVQKLRNIKDIKLIESDENLGFAKGNNLGIKYAVENNFDYILLLNNDTVVEVDAIFKLQQYIEQEKDVGIVAPRIMYYSNKNLINYCGGHIDWLKCATIHENYKNKFDESMPKNFYTEFITGCCMLIKKEVIKDVGMLPEEYFMYFEDADYCVQVKEKGYKLAVNTESTIYHKVSVSSGGENSPFSIKWGNRNRLIFIKKYRKYSKGIMTYLFYYISRFILIMKYMIKGDRERQNALLDGIKEGRRYIKENVIK